jgi:hypothetical protein
MRPLVFAALVALCLSGSHGRAEDLVGPRSFHGPPSTPFKIDSDGNARAVVNEILLRIIGVTETNWEVGLTDDSSETSNAYSQFIPPPHLKRQIVFNTEFMKRIVEADGKWPAYCVAAHEIGHLFRLHLENKFIHRHDFELEADYYCGFVLGKLGSSYDQAISAIRWYSESADYPTREERRDQIARGWKDATGKGTPVSESNPGITNDPRPAGVNSTNDIDQFVTRQNRDIYGADIAFTDGKPGIPGSTLDDCAARCLRSTACKAFSFDRWNGRCFLKSQIKSSLLDPPSTLAVRKPAALPSASQTSAFIEISLRKKFHDQPSRQKKVAARDACRDECMNDLNCVAFNFLRSSKEQQNCEIFNHTNGYYSDEAADIGIKRQSPAPE